MTLSSAWIAGGIFKQVKTKAMPRPIAIQLNNVQLAALLNDTPQAKALADLLPLELSLHRWGDEYYGSLESPLPAPGEEGQQIMAVGDLAYWPPGQAFCVFFGPTPASQGQEPVAAGPVILLGRAQGPWEEVKALGQTVPARLII